LFLRRFFLGVFFLVVSRAVVGFTRVGVLGLDVASAENPIGTGNSYTNGGK